jgi:hypothetical protein
MITRLLKWLFRTPRNTPARIITISRICPPRKANQ